MQTNEDAETKPSDTWKDMKEWNAAIAQSILDEIARQKVSVLRFAKENDLSGPRIHYWKSKLASKAAPKKTVLVPARIVPSKQSGAKEGDDDSMRLELVSPSKWIIRCFGSIDTKKLQAAIEAIGDHQ